MSIVCFNRLVDRATLYRRASMDESDHRIELKTTGARIVRQNAIANREVFHRRFVARLQHDCRMSRETSTVTGGNR